MANEIDQNRSMDRVWVKQTRLALWDGTPVDDEPPPTRRQQVRTVRAKLAFLRAYALCGNVRQSCEIAGVARSTVYGEWMKNERFVTVFEAAHEEASDRLEEEGRR